MEGRLQSVLSRPDEVVLVAGTEREAPMGWIHGAEQGFLESGRRCEILGLVVDSARRRAGVGQQLVEAMEKWALERGLAEISVRSNVARAESHPFYERLGFQRTKTQHVYRKPLTD